MAAIVGPGGPSAATQFAIDGLGGGHLRCDRPLTFIDVNKVYTYLSSDIEYLHGRHLVYTIVAIMFAIVIVIGLSLLLLFEPFLNSKINFIKIKPLFDQFQGCYKDKYHCFAG